MNSVLNTVATFFAKRTKENKTEYREILLRDDPSDAEALRKIMGDEGITPTQLADDQRIFRQAADLETQTADWTPELDGQHDAAWKTLNEHTAESDRIAAEREAERRRLAVDAERLSSQQDRCRDAGRKLKALQLEHAELFGLPTVERAPVPDLTSHAGFAILPNPPETEREKANRRPIPLDLSAMPRAGQSAVLTSAERQAAGL